MAQEAKPSKLLSPSADGLVVLASAPQIGRLEVTVSFPRGIVRRWRPRTRHEVIAYRAMCALTELFPHTDLWESKVRVFLVEGETVASVTTAFGSVFSVYGFPEGVPA